MNRILVTGAGGFLGGSFVRFFRAQGRAVTGFSRSDGNGCVDITGDILDEDALLRAMEGCDTVIHCAALTPYARIMADKPAAARVYLQGMRGLLACMEKTGADALLFPSSGKVYGQKTPLPYREDAPLQPDVYMGALKAECEGMMRAFADAHGGSRMIAARIFNIYGPGQKTEFLIPKIISRLEEKQMPMGPTGTRRDYVYIDDVLRAAAILLQQCPRGFTAVNIGSGTSVSIEEIKNLLCEISGKEFTFLTDPGQIRREEPQQEYGCIEKISALGWRPEIGLAEGLRRTLQAFRQSGA